MAKKIIPYSIIFKRSSCLKSVSESDSYTDVLFEKIKPLMQKSTLAFSESKMIDSYLNAICNKVEANQYYGNAIEILENCGSPERTDMFCKRILPYVEDLNYIKETLDRYENLNENYRESILEYAGMYTVSDRVLKNHESISKRFNIEKEIQKVSYKSLYSVIETCCSMIDTYNLESYKKLNLCIEEMNYLIKKNNFDVDKQELVKGITEYFLLNNSTLTSSDLAKYKLALNESYFLDETDLVSVNYLFNPSKNNHTITEAMNNYLRSPEKNIIIYEETQNSDIPLYTVTDLIYNIGKYIRFQYNIYTSGMTSEDLIIRDLTDILNRIANKLQVGADSTVDSIDYIDKDAIISIIGNAKEYLGTIANDYSSETKFNIFFNIVEDSFIKPLELELDKVYPKVNLEAINFVNEDNNESIKLKDYKIFKFHNLVKASINLDKYLKIKAAKMMDSVKDKGKKILTKVNNVLFNENSSIYEFIGEDNKADICVAQYYYNEADISNIHEYMSYICKDFNNRIKLEGYDTIRSYYIINPGILEVHVKDCTNIELSESELEEVYKSPTKSLDVYIETLALCDTVLEYYNDLDLNESIESRLLKFDVSNMDIDHYNALIESLRFLYINKNTIETITEKFSYSLFEKNGQNYKYLNESTSIRKICESWEAYEDVPLDLQLEAYLCFDAILEDAKNINNKGKFDLKKTKNDPDFDKEKPMSEEEKKELKKNPFKGINLNSIRLCLKGIEAKMKDMSQKEKEISKNLDMGFRRFVKAMRDALISDRREAVIKGSVIPSFSKCMKIAILLAGVAKFINPGLALITALGGFAMSKRLTKKERLLLLDEIEIELDVVDKEIANAESKNQMKKYRQLLKYKKDLQRQYQRIRYNVRVGKDVVPGSTAGMKNYND